MREHSLWIANQWTAASRDEWQSVVDPATEEEVGRVPSATAEDVDKAVLSAKRAYDGWKHLSSDTRVDLLHEAAWRMRDAAPELSITLTHETGRMQQGNQFYIEWSARVFDYYAELARNGYGRVIPSAEPDGQLNMVLKVPYGVVGCIVPWNYPILLLSWKMAPVLAAGNSVVIKPASQTPLTTPEMMEAAFDHLPPGPVNVVTGRGSEIGEALARHPDVPLIALTCSTEVGQRIMEMAVPRLKKLHLELGGKNPAIVYADADLDKTVPAIAWGGFLNVGQVCTSVERIYVERPIYEAFNEQLADFARRLAVGSGFDPETEVTPMISARARDSVHDLVQAAVGDGARLLAGGDASRWERGFFYPPTVVAECTHEMRIMCEETFGPVVGVMPYDDFEEAIALANDSDCALGASLFTNDPRLVRRMYDEVDAGTVWVNDRWSITSPDHSAA